MSKSVEFAFSLGQAVMLPTDNQGTITGLCRKENGDSYLVVWWCESKRYEDWLQEFELRPA